MLTETVLDLDDPQFRRDPYPIYRWLRSEQPVARVVRRGWYAVSRYRDVHEVLSRPEVFSSNVMRQVDPALLGADPPQHTCTRLAATRAMSSVPAIERLVVEEARALAGRLPEAESWDFVESFASRLPAAVMARLLELHVSPETIRSWTRATTPRAGFERPSDEQLGQAREFDSFLMAKVREAACTGAGFAGALLRLSDGRLGLSEDQARGVLKIIIIGGVETTAHLLSNTLRALLVRPDELRAAARDPQRLAHAVREALRYDPPVQFVLRQTTERVEIAGREIPPEAVVAALIAAANRDEQTFEQAEKFCPLRPRHPRPQAFGAGIHSCPGARLARLEAAAGLAALFERSPAVEAAEDLSGLPLSDSMQLRGAQRLLIRTKRGAEC